MSKNHLYKLAFHQNNRIYELYCKQVVSSHLYGFIEAKDLVFDTDAGVVVDPTEERLREEFANVEVLHLPMHSVVRVEQVSKRGQCAIRDSEGGNKITPFPVPQQPKR